MIAKRNSRGATSLIILLQNYTKSKPQQGMMALPDRVIGPLYLQRRKKILSLNGWIERNHFNVWEENVRQLRLQTKYIDVMWGMRLSHKKWGIEKKKIASQSLKHVSILVLLPRGFIIIQEGSVVKSQTQ